jgi:hypothetical protein
MVWLVPRFWVCFNLTNIVLVGFMSHNVANSLYPINIKGHGWLRESNSQKHFYVFSFYLQNIISFPNPNCHSSLIMMIFEMVVTGLPMLEQHRLRLHFHDIVVKSISLYSHLDNLRLAVERMCWYGLKINPLKYVFGVLDDKFLCFIIHEHDIEIDPKKVKIITLY